MYEDDWPNYEKYREKAEAMKGMWLKEKGQDYDISYVYDVTFNTDMNDWVLSLYTVDRIQNTITNTDWVCLDEVSEYFRKISKNTGLRIYNQVKKYLDDVFEGKEENGKCEL